MSPPPLPLNCVLACASASTYGIDPSTGVYTPQKPFGDIVSFDPALSIINSSGTDRINAALVGKNANGIIVAFRGTIPPTNVDSIPDWLEDFFTEPSTCGTLPGKIHSGFCHDIQSIISSVTAAVRALDPLQNKVFVTGHSKGGALASLGAYLLTQAGIPVQQVVTFASPKTGDPDFRTGYQKIIPNQIRYENYGDLVPLLPPSASFLPGVAAVMAQVPDVGKQLAALLKEAQGWDYIAVGQEYFIESSANKYAIDTSESEADQVGGFIINLVMNGLDLAKTLVNAHSIDCNLGYISGSCPSSVCGAV